MMWIIAQTESIHFDSPKWIKNHENILIREVNQNVFYFWFTWANHFILILIHFDSLSKRTNRKDSFWFTLFFHIDSIWFTRKNKEWPYFDFVFWLVFLKNWVVGDCPSLVALFSWGKCANTHPTLPFQTQFRWLSIYQD